MSCMISESHAENDLQRNYVSLADTFRLIGQATDENRLILRIKYAQFDLCKVSRHFYVFR